MHSNGSTADGSAGAVEHLDVIVVGAGLSGIGAAHHVQHECPWASYAVLESRDAIGGTWDLFRYPGIRSDSDMFTFSYPFRPWTEDRSIGDGAAILRYIQETAAEEGIDRRIRFHHRIVSAAWRGDEARWHVTAERTDTGETVELTCGFLFSCTGYYRYDRGHQPDFPGLDDFAGTLVHPQAWPEDLDYAGKRIVVIGSGATAITLVPSLAATAGHVTMLQRSPTYVASLPTRNPLTRAIRKVVPAGRQGAVLRWTNALTTQAFYHASQRFPGAVKRALRAGVRRELPPGYDVDTHFRPTYDPWDQRLCVVTDGDLFRAVRAGTASVVTDHVDRFTPTGIRLRSGQHLDADIVVTATGLDLLFLGGIELTVDGAPVDVGSRMAYKGMMLEGVPNLALAIGYTNASWTLRSDLTCDWVCRLLNHMRATGDVRVTPVSSGARSTGKPLLGLTSGYVLRAADRFPKQGSRAPWQLRQSYLSDYRATKRDPLIDADLQLSGPAAPAAPAEAAVGAGV